LFASGIKANALLMLDPISFEQGAILNLAGAKLGALVDSPKSWPARGDLRLDRLTYDILGGDAVTAKDRLRWLALQPGFFSQTYRQLANVRAESGEDTDATQVRIAAEDLRYSRYGPLGRIWGTFLKYTIAYGHRPMLTVMWSLAVMLLGWAVV